MGPRCDGACLCFLENRSASIYLASPVTRSPDTALCGPSRSVCACVSCAVCSQIGALPCPVVSESNTDTSFVCTAPPLQVDVPSIISVVVAGQASPPVLFRCVDLV
jgi:hypothetical protein